MSVIVLAALFTLAVLVMVLSGFQLAQRTLVFMAALLGAIRLAIWFFFRPASGPLIWIKRDRRSRATVSGSTALKNRE